MVSPKAFEKAFKKIGIGDWHGKRQGRFYHEGYGVSFGTLQEYGRFVAGLAKDPAFEWLIAHDPQIDDLGRGIIASWDVELFTE